MPYYRYLSALCIIFAISVSFAIGQRKPANLSNLRRKYISTKDVSARFDSLSVVPNTFVIKDVPAFAYELDEVNAVIKWKIKPVAETVYITYRVFPYKLNAVSRQFNFDSIRYNFTYEPPVTLKDESFNNKVFDFGNVNYSGSVGRGLSVGNNQDASVSSSLNLQVNGFIGDSLQLSAAISDNNIPVQPEGNTQSINDFDKIYMEVKKRGWKASFGDIDIRQSKNYFLNFYKRLQGASFQTDNKIGNAYNSLLVTGAIAKGKFTRNIITPQEGNQGPYKLSNPNQEIFFVVLASTERVFLDGQLLVRGDDQDYVINYNTAEVRFTPKHLITKDSRIQIEFEYADRNFLNSQLYANDEITVNKRLKMSIGAFSNVDAKNSPINQTLDDNQKQFLSSIGNNIDSATYPNAVRDTFAIDKILYTKRDTSYLVSGNTIHDSIFTYSISKTDTLYNVSFLFVGEGKGRYVLDQGNANGKVYRWIPPSATGVRLGDYEPVILLATPKKHQLISTVVEYAVSHNTTIKAEGAVSNYDVNTFSSKDKGKDVGGAFKFQFVNDLKVLPTVRKGLLLNTHGGYEYVQDRFQPIERLRNVEFNRDWSLPFDAPAATEHLINGGMKLKDKSSNFIQYDFTNYTRSDNYVGYRHLFSHFMQLKRWKVNDQVSETVTNSDIQHGTFFRPSIDISRLIGKKNYEIGGGFSEENNKILNKQADTLNPLSFSFDIWQAYIRSPLRKLNKWSITYSSRVNKFPVQKQLLTSDKSHTINFTTELLQSEHHQLKLNLTYRKLQILDQAITKEQADESFLARAEYAVNKWHGFVVGSALYEIGAGQEQKLQYTFVQVPTGQGEYTWIDYNNDGIPQLNEFEIAVYQDQKNYVKVYTPTNEYVKANYIQLNYSLTLTPRVLISSKTKNSFKHFISKFSSNSVLQVNKKDISNGSFDFSPFSKQLVDTSLLSLNSFLSNSLYFNRSSVKWSVDLTHRLTTTKAILTYGFESRKVSDISLRGRYNLNRTFSTSLINRYSTNDLITPKFSNRNFSIREGAVEPSLIYIRGSRLRISIIYDYDEKHNITGIESSINNSLSTDVKYNVLSNGTLSGKFTVNNISFVGTPSSTVGYTILDGLLPGRNYLWNLELTKRIAGNIEMDIQYEGRKPQDTKIINIGRATLRALF